VSDFTVHQYGTDTSGRPVFMTVFMHLWFEAYVDELGWRPEVEQGAFMERLGGGAVASSGAHNKAKCLDLRTVGRTTAEIDRMVRIARKRGAGACRRDMSWRHGSMPQHMHLTLGADQPGSDMADMLWSSYVGGGDGLALQPPQPDYEWRPDPLILTPPPLPPKDDLMAFSDWNDAEKKAFGDFIENHVTAAMVDVVNPDGTRTPWHLGALLRDLKASVDAIERKG
jgi:hypothetical protein